MFRSKYIRYKIYLKSGQVIKIKATGGFVLTRVGGNEVTEWSIKGIKGLIPFWIYPSDISAVTQNKESRVK